MVERRTRATSVSKLMSLLDARSSLAALKQWPELDETDQKVAQSVMPNVPEKARAAFMDTMTAPQGSSQGREKGGAS